jgi:hypothetical protein
MRTKLILLAVGIAAGFMLKDKLATKPVFSQAYNLGSSL